MEALPSFPRKMGCSCLRDSAHTSGASDFSAAPDHSFSDKTGNRTLMGAALKAVRAFAVCAAPVRVRSARLEPRGEAAPASESN